MVAKKNERMKAVWKLLLRNAQSTNEIGMHPHEICYQISRSNIESEKDLFMVRDDQKTPWETLTRDINQMISKGEDTQLRRLVNGKSWVMSKLDGKGEIFITVNGEVPRLPALETTSAADEYVHQGLEIRKAAKLSPVNEQSQAHKPPQPNEEPEPSDPWTKLSAFATDPKRRWSPCKSERLSANIILEGVPGTGKTYALSRLAEAMPGKYKSTIATGKFAITMHPATSYEDFVEGLRPGEQTTSNSDSEYSVQQVREMITQASIKDGPRYFFESPTGGGDNGPTFCIHDGFFVAACAAAVRNPNTPHVVLLDELNRCNIPKVMGDLITTMEVSKRARWDGKKWKLDSAQLVTLPYSKRLFFVPDNITIVGTMNTTDRSVAPMDAALRRRFVFVRVEPDFGNIRLDSDNKEFTAVFKKALELITQLNTALRGYLGADSMLGHSYFYDMKREIDNGGDAPKVIEFYFNKVIFPMVVDTLANNGCLAELADSKAGNGDQKGLATAAALREKVEPFAKFDFSGRGITQTLTLTLEQDALQNKSDQGIATEMPAQPVQSDSSTPSEV
jgi:hypothetical protein